MRLYEAVGLFARRLKMRPGRIQAIAGRLQEAGRISKCEGSRRFPVEIGDAELVFLLIAAIGESGIGTARETVDRFSNLTNAAGRRFGDVVSELLFGPPRHVQHVIVRQAPAGVSIVVDGHHDIFGAEPPEHGATGARLVPGATINAIAAELQGMLPAAADAAAAITKLRGNLVQH